jgi:hypothetical protein
MSIKQLRDKFFRECCAKQEDGLQDVNLTPHNTFEWFVKHFYSEEEVLELLLKSKIETSNLYYEDMTEWFETFKKK